MPKVEQTDMSQVYRFFKEHKRRNHAQCDKIPECPHSVPVLSSGNAIWWRRVKLLGDQLTFPAVSKRRGEERKNKSWSFNQP